ncbi:hypothetical protein [uncultured Amphritea sp.]|uniref:hypothetical protein n=1 Tax=uncultured Amphritea sp. TaxID=981605 RepID=UPI00262AFE7D|nr:hypothetical protein [uncultured Amphritea sp.]
MASGSGTLFTVAQRVVRSGSGPLFNVSQIVVRSGSGRLFDVAQIVNLRQSGKGRLFNVAQIVKHSGSGTLFKVAQRVKDPAVKYQFNQEEGGLFGWSEFDLIVTIGNTVIDPGLLTDTISITRREGDSALATLTLQPDYGPQNLSQYHGKRVTISASSASKTKLMYDGIVDLPKIDLIYKKITLECTDSRTEKNNALSAAFVQGIGYHSPAVFTEPADLNEELTQRLQTIPYAFDYGSDGIGRLTPWAPKATPDFTIDDDVIYYRNPTASVLSRGRVTNKITITLTYNYQLLRWRERQFSFDSGLSAFYYGSWGLPPSNIQLKQAIQAAGWPYDNYQFVGLDPAGKYGDIHWSPKVNKAKIAPKLDADGNQVTDQNGNPVYEQTGRTVSDSTNLYANTATWTASKRWAQNVTESIEITLQAPQSIQQYGEVSNDVSYGVADDYDATDWEAYEAHKAPPASASQSANGDYLISKATDIAGFNNMALTALNREATKIIKGHRDNRVEFEVPCWPDVEMHHTIETTGGTVKAKAKVSAITHTFDLGDKEAATEIELSLSQSISTTTNTPITVPNRPPIVDANYTPQVIKLSAHTIPLNGEQNTDWTGYIFQELVRPGKAVRYGLKAPVALIIDTQDIDDQSRDTREISSKQAYNIEIRNDLLEVIF